MNRLGSILKLVLCGYAFYKNPTTHSSRLFFEMLDEVFSRKEVKDNTYSNVDDESRDTETDVEEQKCIMCETNKKNIVLIPCSHTVGCIGCTKKLIQYTNKCPLCRTMIEDRIFYFS